MKLDTYEAYLECVETLARLDPDYDFEEFGEVSERLQLLPGFPQYYNPQEDIIVPVLPRGTPPLVALNAHN